MSNTGSTSPDISEEDHEGNTRKTSEEHDEVITQENREKQNENDTQGISEAVRKATEDDVKEIFDQLKTDQVSKIILTGKAGTGKTWMARKISESATKEKLYEPIWISLDTEHDEESLCDTIARQLSLPTITDAREEAGENEKQEKNEKGLKEKMEKELKAASKAKKFLIVLDGQLEMMTEKDEKEEINEQYIKKKLGLEGVQVKFLITRRKCEAGDSSEKTRVYKLKPLSGNEAVQLVNKEYDKKDLDPQILEALSRAIEQKSEILPAEILMLVGNLNYIAKDNSGDWDLKHALKVATNDLKQLLRYIYDREPGNCMIDCFWHSWHLLRKHGGVHYNELITYWIMEGYLNRANQIDKAYEEGHSVLMKLINCHMLKMQEDNVVVLEGAIPNMNEYCRRGYSGAADPGLASVLKDCAWKVLDRITPADGLMKTLCRDKKEKMISSLIIDGSRLCREVLESFFDAKQNLSLLAIFYPRLKSPKELSIPEMKKLLVLILRGSYLLKDVNDIVKLKALTILEISGSIHLKEMPDEFFREVSQLRSLDLSGAGIESLPPTFSELTELRRLICRQCSSLRELPKLEKFSKLEVIDLSGSTMFEKIQEESFNSLEKLQVINFSQTKIEKLPIVKTLTNLTKLLLQGCCQLSVMRRLKQVSSLKILDLSGSRNIKEIMYDIFEGTESLRELDLSETEIQFLPPVTGNLQKLRLKGCILLKNLPELGRHSGLEELELSGCKGLVKLPNLTALQDLKILGLENCINLETLPVLNSLSKLQKLDLRGTKLWSEGLEESLSPIARPQLQILK